MTKQKEKSQFQEKPGENAVVDLNAYRIKRETTGDRRFGLQDTFQISTPGKPSGTRGADFSENQLSQRIERLKSSINRINKLMDELRGDSDKKNNKTSH